MKYKNVEPKTNVHILMPTKLLKELRVVCDIENLTQSELIREIIIKYLKKSHYNLENS